MIPSETIIHNWFDYIYFYGPKKNASRTDIADDDQKSYAFNPTYRDGSTDLHHHMISVVVFYSSGKLQSMLVDYLVR